MSVDYKNRTTSAAGLMVSRRIRDISARRPMETPWVWLKALW
jgi:hypothetical protein